MGTENHVLVKLVVLDHVANITWLAWPMVPTVPRLLPGISVVWVKVGLALKTTEMVLLVLSPMPST